MATRQLLQSLAAQYGSSSGVEIALESVGGVDAARRVAAGEPFDVVVLAADAMAGLRDSGALVSGSDSMVALSCVALALPADRAVPVIGTVPQLVDLILASGTVGYSTGPSGKALLERLARWGVLETLRPRLLQAPPGQPVAAMVARGEVGIGFQQLSEMIHSPGITLLTRLPADAEIVTAFVAGVCAVSGRAEAAKAFIDFLCSTAADAAKRSEGMQPASAASGGQSA